MFDLTKLDQIDIANLNLFLIETRNQNFQELGVVVFVPGAQQYSISKFGTTLYLMPNLVIEKPFALNRNGAKIFLRCAKKRAQLKSVGKPKNGLIKIKLGSFTTHLIEIDVSDFPTEKKEIDKNIIDTKYKQSTII